ncbi:MAG: hypothetical protein JO122_13730 [Acetobacteraceae bacterium]|nr:hypothetical protein [Acetobacteraceae bacterium]
MANNAQTEDHVALGPCEIVALADEMNTAGFPEIAEVLIGLAYELADRAEVNAMTARLIEKDWPVDARSGWIRG